MKCPKCGSEIKDIFIPDNYHYDKDITVCTNYECEYHERHCLDLWDKYDKELTKQYHQQRLDKVLSKFDLTFHGCDDKAIKIHDNLLIFHDYVFQFCDKNGSTFKNWFPISLDTVEHLLNDLKED